VTSARDVALQAVRDVFPATPQTIERGAQEALDYRVRKANLSTRDRAFATELAYGAIKMRRTLDWYLEPFIGGRDQPLSAVIREVLRLAIYELVYTRPDVHATVFEWVNVAKRYGHRGVANLVNAVLRSFLRDRPLEPARELFASDEEYLGTRYSLPTWIVRQWTAVFGDQVERICAAVNEPAATAVTVNVAKSTVFDVMEKFIAQKVGVTASSGTNCTSTMITGSSDIYEWSGRDAYASVSLTVTAVIANPPRRDPEREPEGTSDRGAPIRRGASCAARHSPDRRDRVPEKPCRRRPAAGRAAERGRR